MIDLSLTDIASCATVIVSVAIFFSTRTGKRFDKIDEEFKEVKKEMNQGFKELTQEIEDLKEEANENFKEVRQDISEVKERIAYFEGEAGRTNFIHTNTEQFVPSESARSTAAKKMWQRRKIKRIEHKDKK